MPDWLPPAGQFQTPTPIDQQFGQGAIQQLAGMLAQARQPGPATSPSFVPYKIGPDGVPFPDTNPVASGMDPAVAQSLGFPSPSNTLSPDDLATLAKFKAAMGSSQAPAGSVADLSGAGAMSVPSSPTLSPEDQQRLAAFNAQNPRMTPLSPDVAGPMFDKFRQEAAARAGQQYDALEALNGPGSLAIRAGAANAAMGLNPDLLTKHFGGNMGTPAGASQLTPQQTAADAASHTMAGDVGLPANMPSGQMLGGDFVPNSAIGPVKSPGELSPPMSPTASADRTADILREEANPQRQAMDSAMAGQLLASKPKVQQHAQEDRMIRHGVPPAEAMLPELLQSTGGGGAAADIIFPQLAAGRRADRSLDIQSAEAQGRLAQEANTEHVIWARGLNDAINAATQNNGDVQAAVNRYKATNPEPAAPNSVAFGGQRSAPLPPSPNGQMNVPPDETNHPMNALSQEQISTRVNQMLTPLPGQPTHPDAAKQAIEFLGTISQSAPSLAAHALALHPELKGALDDYEYENNPALWKFPASTNPFFLPMTDQSQKQALANIYKARRLRNLVGWTHGPRITGAMPPWAPQYAGRDYPRELQGPD